MPRPPVHPAQSVLAITVGFVVIFLLGEYEWALWIAVGVGLAGTLSYWLAQHIDRAWRLIGKGLSYIVPNILLALFFYLFLFPISLLARIWGKKDPLRLERTAKSVYHDRDKTFDKQSFERPW